MTTSRSHRARVAAGLLGTLAIVATGLVGSPAAHAAPGNIDTTTPGSVTIHKHLENGSTKTTPNGGGGVSGKAVQGVEYTIFQLNYKGAAIDLSKFDDWTGLANVRLNADCSVSGAADYSRGAQVSKVTTGADGAATHDTGTARTAFAVCETSTNGARIAGESTHMIDKSAPFVVSVPMPHDTEWLYNVHAYPKGSSVGITKTVTSQPAGALGLGAEVTFPVSTEIPVLAKDAGLSGYIVRDVLDKRLHTPGVKSVTVDGKAVAAEHYTVKASAGNPQDLRVVFSASGLAWLKTQGGKKVVTSFAGTVQELGDGAIPNTATLFANEPGADTDATPATPGVTSNTVTSNWGDVIVKASDGANNKSLAGAKFQLFAADPAYAADGKACTSKVATGAAISVGSGTNAQTTFTTGSDGQVTIPGLFVSDSENGAKDAGQRCYLLVKTAAPAGYTLPKDDAAKAALTVHAGASTAVDIDVKSTKQGVPELPLTGAAGQMVMIAGGGALLAGAISMLVTRRRRSKQG